MEAVFFTIDKVHILIVLGVVSFFVLCMGLLFFYHIRRYSLSKETRLRMELAYFIGTLPPLIITLFLLLWM